MIEKENGSRSGSDEAYIKSLKKDIGLDLVYGGINAATVVISAISLVQALHLDFNQAVYQAQNAVFLFTGLSAAFRFDSAKESMTIVDSIKKQMKDDGSAD